MKHGRLIDADALKKKFINANAEGINLAIDRYALKCIEDAPTIEPERKTGRWIPCTERMRRAINGSERINRQNS